MGKQIKTVVYLAQHTSTRWLPLIPSTVDAPPFFPAGISWKPQKSMASFRTIPAIGCTTARHSLQLSFLRLKMAPRLNRMFTFQIRGTTWFYSMDIDRKTANQQAQNMYVKVVKFLKEVTILHSFLSAFFIFKAQFMKINKIKTSILCLAYIVRKICIDYFIYKKNSRE